MSTWVLASITMTLLMASQAWAGSVEITTGPNGVPTITQSREKSKAPEPSATPNMPPARSHSEPVHSWSVLPGMSRNQTPVNDDKPRDSESWLSRGLELYEKGHFQDAIQAFDRALVLKPEYSLGYLHRGRAWHTLGQLDQARKDYDQALFFDSKCAAAYNNRGILFYQQKNVEMSIRDFGAALGINPALASTYIHRAESYAALGQYAMGWRDIKSALKIEPGILIPPVYQYLAEGERQKMSQTGTPLTVEEQNALGRAWTEKFKPPQG